MDVLEYQARISISELWLERNARTFDKVAVLPMELCRRITMEFEQWKRVGLWGLAANSGVLGGVT
jgi:hypothetical protein